MKVRVKIYLVKDILGNTESATCKEGCDRIQICTMVDNNLSPLYFETEAYHLQGWCETHGIEFKQIDKEFDFDELWNQ